MRRIVAGASTSVGASVVLSEENFSPIKRQFEKRVPFQDEPVRLWRPGVAPGTVEVARELFDYGEAVATQTVGTSIRVYPAVEPRDDEQARVFDEASYLVASVKSFIVQAPTGFGKTPTGCRLIAELGRTALVVVSQRNHATQWRDAVREFLGLEPGDVGFWQGKKVPDPSCKVVVAMLQSIYRDGCYDDEVYRRFGIVIFDEVDRLGADEFGKVVWKLPALVRVGLTATSRRRDGKDVVFRAHIGPVAVVSEALPMVPKVLRVRSALKLPRKRVRRADGAVTWIKQDVTPGKTTWVDKVIARHPDRNAQIGRIAKVAYDRGRNIVVFAKTRDHLDRIRVFASKAGVPLGDVGLYVGGKSEEALAEAAACRVVLATVQMGGRGVDCPWWDAAVAATPGADVEQMIGRVLRQYPDKPEPIIFDMVDEDSPILSNFAKNRVAHYEKIGAEVKWIRV